MLINTLTGSIVIVCQGGGSGSGPVTVWRKGEGRGPERKHPIAVAAGQAYFCFPMSLYFFLLIRLCFDPPTISKPGYLLQKKNSRPLQDLNLRTKIV